MSSPQIELNLAVEAFKKFRTKLTLEEYLVIMRIGFHVHKPEGYTFEGIKKEMVKIFVVDEGKAFSITCLECDSVSYHKDDVVNLYCGKCNEFKSGDQIMISEVK